LREYLTARVWLKGQARSVVTIEQKTRSGEKYVEFVPNSFSRLDFEQSGGVVPICNRSQVETSFQFISNSNCL
jgi:hypothetical protein